MRVSEVRRCDIAFEQADFAVQLRFAPLRRLDVEPAARRHAVLQHGQQRAEPGEAPSPSTQPVAGPPGQLGMGRPRRAWPSGWLIAAMAKRSVLRREGRRCERAGCAAIFVVARRARPCASARAASPCGRTGTPGTAGGQMQSVASRRKYCLTMRSSNEWKLMTARRPPCEFPEPSRLRASGRAALRVSSSPFTRIRSARKTLVAG